MFCLLEQLECRSRRVITWSISQTNKIITLFEDIIPSYSTVSKVNFEVVANKSLLSLFHNSCSNVTLGKLFGEIEKNKRKDSNGEGEIS